MSENTSLQTIFSSFHYVSAGNKPHLNSWQVELCPWPRPFFLLKINKICKKKFCCLPRGPPSSLSTSMVDESKRVERCWMGRALFPNQLADWSELDLMIIEAAAAPPQPLIAFSLINHKGQSLFHYIRSYLPQSHTIKIPAPYRFYMMTAIQSVIFSIIWSFNQGRGWVGHRATINANSALWVVTVPSCLWLAAELFSCFVSPVKRLLHQAPYCWAQLFLATLLALTFACGFQRWYAARETLPEPEPEIKG